MASENMPNVQNECVRLRYLRWEDKFAAEKPFKRFADIPADAPPSERGNVTFEEGPEEIVTDVRGCNQKFTLDDNGFAFINYTAPFTNWENPDAIVVEFYQEVTSLLKEQVDDVDLVHIFEHRVSQYRKYYLLLLRFTAD